jgi:hypothetical protein
MLKPETTFHTAQTRRNPPFPKSEDGKNTGLLLGSSKIGLIKNNELNLIQKQSIKFQKLYLMYRSLEI